MNIFEVYKLIKRGHDLKIITPDYLHMSRKLQEEVSELVDLLENNPDRVLLLDEIGDVLVCVFRITYHLHISPIVALANAVRKVSSRFDEMDRILKGGGMTHHNLTRTDAINLYKNAKQRVIERKEVACGHDGH